MWKISLLLLLLICKFSNAQNKELYGEVHVESLIYQSDTLTFNPPKVIVITKTGATPIVPLGNIKSLDFALQFELLESKIGTSEFYLLGKCLFVKNLKGWKEFSRFEHMGVVFNSEPKPPEIENAFLGTYGAEEDMSAKVILGSWYFFYKK